MLPGAISARHGRWCHLSDTTGARSPSWSKCAEGVRSTVPVNSECSYTLKVSLIVLKLLGKLCVHKSLQFSSNFLLWFANFTFEIWSQTKVAQGVKRLTPWPHGEKVFGDFSGIQHRSPSPQPSLFLLACVWLCAAARWRGRFSGGVKILDSSWGEAKSKYWFMGRGTVRSAFQ